MTNHALPAFGAGFALGTFTSKNRGPFAGVVIGDSVIPCQDLLAASGGAISSSSSLFDLLQDWPRTFALLDAAVKKHSAAGPGAPALPLSAVQPQAPVGFPRQILCAGANYFKHVVQLLVDQGAKGTLPGMDHMNADQLREFATELMTRRKREGEPYFFLKAASAVTGPFDPIFIPASAKQPDWELELGVYIGKAARYVKAADAMSHVAGYTIVNDITDRALMWRKDDMKAMGTDWVCGKNSPSYLPTGPYLVPAAFVPKPHNLQLTLKLNGEIKQDEDSGDMIHDIPRLIEYISSKVQLYPGDLICTGSPAGNGTHYNRFLQPNDVVETTITGLGMQRNPVLAEKI